VFLQLSWTGQLEQTESNSTLKTIIFMKYSIPKLTQFSHRHIMIDAGSFWHIWLSLERFMCFSTQLNRPIWRKQSLSPPETGKLQEVFLTTLTQFSQEINVLYAPASKTDVFLSKDTCVSSRRPMWKQLALSLPWKQLLAGITPFKTNSILLGKQCTRCCSF
jgi:hypothetical protein